MFEEKIINGEVVRRSKKWPNYGVTKSGKPYRWNTERLMKTQLFGGVGDDKYVVFRTCHNNIAKNTYLHTVVAECWIENPYPETKTQVNHKDGNKRNFEVDNLEWCSPAENLQHCSIKLGAKGENLYNASLSDDQVHIICRMLLDGLRPKDIADMFDVTVDAVRKIKAGDTYFHVRSLYDIPHTYLSEFSESTVRWVCERLCEGLADNKISAIATNKNLKTIDIKRIRYKIRYKHISDEYFGDPFNDYP